MNEEMNEMISQGTEPAEVSAIEASDQTTAEASSSMGCDALMEALTEAKIKLTLLLCGVDKTKLEEGARLAATFAVMGLTPEQAAEKAAAEYPHLKLAKREIPTFAAQSGGSGDGFSAIRSIFAKR